MKKTATALLYAMVASTSQAETAPVTAAPASAVPANAGQTAANTTPAAPRPAPAAPAALNTTVPSVAPDASGATPVVEPSSAEQRRQAELLSNAERIDKANRELLARNQELQLQNENLNLQNNVLQRDKSSEGIWKGALAVIAGFLLGWYFAGSRRKSGW